MQRMNAKDTTSTKFGIDEYSSCVIGCAKEVHEAQLLTHVKLAGAKIGSLVNFNNNWLKDGSECFVL